MIDKYRSYRRDVEKKSNSDPKKIIFFRDGVSEGQFQQVLDIGALSRVNTSIRRQIANPVAELPRLKCRSAQEQSIRYNMSVDDTCICTAACADAGIEPAITVIVVGKRHHVRLFPDPQQQNQADKSGNCRAGTVVDTDIVHPIEFDFYLQSHAGILGTSRSAHYAVLYDENNYTCVCSVSAMSRSNVDFL